jgi:hypothetical protein
MQYALPIAARNMEITACTQAKGTSVSFLLLGAGTILSQANRKLRCYKPASFYSPLLAVMAKNSVRPHVETT